jgi:hypothetical protein
MRAAAGAVLLAALAGCQPSSHGRSESSTASTQATNRSSVHIAKDVFAWDDRLSISNESILVNGSASSATLIEALYRAAERLMNVDSEGVEHGSDYEEPLIGANGDELYTANYVSDPKETRRGIDMYVDCKGVITPPMRVRFFQILTAELGSVGGDVTVSVDR